MITEVPFSITQSDVRATSHFLIESKELELNSNPSLIKIIGQFTAKSNAKTIRRRFESRTFSLEEVTDTLISSYKEEWIESFRKHCKETL